MDQFYVKIDIPLFKNELETGKHIAKRFSNFCEKICIDEFDIPDEKIKEFIEQESKGLNQEDKRRLKTIECIESYKGLSFYMNFAQENFFGVNLFVARKIDKRLCCVRCGYEKGIKMANIDNKLEKIGYTINEINEIKELLISNESCFRSYLMFKLADELLSKTKHNVKIELRD